MPPYRGRFAPSPSGDLHLGTARTALLAWLRARAEGGALVLRMEDLDGPRVRPGSARSILEDLAWLGLDWDEGPDRGGPFGPYEQSRRQGLYEAAFRRLRDAGAVYPCTCSRREVEASASAPHGEEGAPYPGTCRGGPSHPGREPAWRFRMQRAEPFDDALWGNQAGWRDDFVVRRADGVFSYQLACAVDDAAMGITEVLRGADLLGSASRQQALHKALGQAPPAWAHVPLLLGPDGGRLAKRHGATALSAWRAAGWSPERLCGLLAHGLGLAPEGASPRPAELLEGFTLKRIGTRGTVFNGPWPDGRE